MKQGKNINKNLTIFIISTSILLICCSDNNLIDKELIEWFWVIKIIKYKDQDYTNKLTNKDMHFDRFSKESADEKYFKFLTNIPGFNYIGEAPGVYGYKANWKIIKSNSYYFIDFDTKHPFFQGKHKIQFIKDEKLLLLNLIISSENLYVVCQRSYINLQQMEHLDELIKMTGGRIEK